MPSTQDLEADLTEEESRRLTLQGAPVAKPIPGVGGPGEENAITGGTGTYQNATGNMR
jgi:hypothetical protein